jgi:hypothetical protein
MFFLSCRIWYVSLSHSVWNHIWWAAAMPPRISWDCLWCWLAHLLLLWNRIEIENHSLFLEHLVLPNLSQTSFFWGCTISCAVTLHLMFLLSLRTFNICVLLRVPSCKTSCKKLPSKHRLINNVLSSNTPL